MSEIEFKASPEFFDALLFISMMDEARVRTSGFRCFFCGTVGIIGLHAEDCAWIVIKEAASKSVPL